MASATKVTWKKREQRRKNAGRDRKAQLRIHGTTPKFAVHTAASDANAPAEQLSPEVRAAAGT